MIQKILVFLLAMICIVMGLKSCITREARFSLGRRSDQNDEERIVEGFPAILVGLFEVGAGIFVLLHGRSPW
jgi:hypothetical protein